MSEAPSLNDRIAARLERLAEMDFAAAEKVHAQLMAAETPEETAALSRSYQRVSRSARQCLMLQMRYERERGAQLAQAKILNRRDEAIREAKVETRTTPCRRRSSGSPRPPSPMRPSARTASTTSTWSSTTGSKSPTSSPPTSTPRCCAPCRAIDLPEDLAKAWRRLPPPVYPEFDDAPAPTDAATPEPFADTG